MHATRPDQREEPNLAAVATEHQEVFSSSWPYDGAGRLADERRAEGQRSSTGEMYQRSMRSYWKTTVFNRYGGEIWLFTLIATGRVHPI